MSEKTRWLSTACRDVKKHAIDVHISWSDSESECGEVDGCFQNKKLKVEVKSLSKSKSGTWINITSNTTPPKCSQNHVEVGSQIVDCVSTPTRNCAESPIISSLTVVGHSPVLTQMHTKSPVIDRRKIIARIKRQCKFESDKKAEEIAPDDSSTTCTPVLSQVTISSGPSPTKSTQISISSCGTQLSQVYKIDQLSSPHSVQVYEESSTVNSSDSKTYKPPTKRRCKKGGIASQLRKALNSQNTSLAIWQHEMFLKGEMEAHVSDDFQLEFCVVSKQTEYGCTILECKCNCTLGFSKLLMKFDYSGVECSNTFFVIVDETRVTNVVFNENVHYKIFPPYFVKQISYEHVQKICFINTSRFTQI